MALNKVKSGDPLSISATTFNTIIDATRFYQNQQHDTRQQPILPQRNNSIVLVRNDSLGDRSRFEVLGINGVLISPTDNLAEFSNRVVLKGVRPKVPPGGGALSDSFGRFVILLEPIKAGQIGKAVIDGICNIRVEMTYETDDYADVIPGVTTYLRSGYAGSAFLLWVEPEAERNPSNIAWAVARLGVSNNELRHVVRSFWARIDEITAAGSNKWMYTFTEVVKTNVGFGASVWTNASITGDAGNLYEALNSGSGTLGIGITVAELEDVNCPMELRPIPVGSIVPMKQLIIHKEDDTTALEYWFERANGVWST